MKKIMVLSALLCVFFSFSSCNTSGDSSDVYYTVSFNSNGGSFVTAQSIKSGETAKQPVSPIRENYIFNGWYKGSYKFYFSTPITESITLTAKWKAETETGTEEGNTNTYTITYNTTYGTKPSSLSLAENTVLTEEHLPTLTSENKVFLGWYNGETKVNVGDKITGNLNLTAKWEEENISSISSTIKNMSVSGEIKVTGNATTELISEINKSLKELAASNKDILVTLDLSEVTGLTCLEGAYSYADADYASKSFYGCSNLESIILPNTLEKIGFCAFKDCTSLKSIIIPDSVTSIVSDAFSGCTALEEITLPFVGGSATAKNQSRESLFGYIFGSSSYVGAITTEQIYISGDNTYNLTCFLPPKLKKVTITSGEILNRAFYNCSSLTNITIGSGVTSIGVRAFDNCTSLSNITIGNGVTSIGSSVFDNCTSLSNITIGNGVTSIGFWAFNNCASLAEVNYTGSLAQWCEISFSNEESNPCCQGGKLCINGEEITDLVIPDEIITIKAYSFYNCKGIKSVTIGNGVTSIGYKACYECTSLASVIIGGGVKTIGADAFSNCSALTSVVFSDSSTWYYSDKSAYTDGSAIDSAKLENAATAANYLKNTYKSKYWYKL